MPKIKKLSEALTSQIAAGEVVERPASVVKELVENSLDASARSIFVFIERSGKDRIRVSDDGVGMEAADARLALERHATSKLSSASDLTGITTLGFRGEALPSIASVSHLTLRSRAQGGAIGHELVLEGGKLVREGEIGLPEGTLVDVRRLFYSVPARRKFLRADVTEASHIAALISNLAASFPQVQFRLEHGKRTILNAPSASSRRERLYQIEKSWVESAIHLEESAGSLHIDAWLSPPAASRGAASRIHLFVNGRPVKDRVLTHAVMEAYRQAFSKTGTPLLYLFLELPPEKVDVNVHPAK
ncbi:MAG: DNA mismatch repair endonuclease MutL, partial [Acidobacteriota bacterium]